MRPGGAAPKKVSLPGPLILFPILLPILDVMVPKERDELEANAAKVTPSGGKAAFRIERWAVTVVFD